MTVTGLTEFQALTYFYDEEAQLTIGDTYYMTYHTTCITSKEFYTALIKSREIVAGINDMFKENNLDINVFAYRWVDERLLLGDYKLIPVNNVYPVHAVYFMSSTNST